MLNKTAVFLSSGYQLFMSKFLIIFFSAILLHSCKKDTAGDQLGQQTLLNVSYGNHASQKMDVYLPAGRTATATKAIILIHGGGWNAGDKSDFASYISVLKQRLPDYAIFNINYRLAISPDLFPTQEMDVKAVVQFIINSSDEYQVNSNKLVLLGASAGGHLALLQAYKHDNGKIKAVIDFFGPTELVEMYNNPPNPLVPSLLQIVTGATLTSNLQIYLDSSPVNFISSSSPPTLIFHGGIDNIVHVSQSQLLSTALATTGIQHQLVIYSIEGHGWTGTNLNDSFDKIASFLNVHVP